MKKYWLLLSIGCLFTLDSHAFEWSKYMEYYLYGNVEYGREFKKDHSSDPFLGHSFGVNLAISAWGFSDLRSGDGVGIGDDEHEVGLPFFGELNSFFEYEGFNRVKNNYYDPKINFGLELGTLFCYLGIVSSYSLVDNEFSFNVQLTAETYSYVSEAIGLRFRVFVRTALREKGKEPITGISLDIIYNNVRKQRIRLKKQKQYEAEQEKLQRQK